MSTTTEKPRRKFPPPCWTQEETLVLIESYREKWYALRRGYLRTADWEAVASEVTGRCPNVTPAKTSAQCRHKMEKLRQRYRTDKQRSLSNPGHFFSSWMFYENMDSMEIGPSSAIGSNQDQVKNLIDRNSVPVAFKSKKIKMIDRNYDSGRNSVSLGIRAKNGVEIGGNSNPSYGSRGLNGNSVYLDDGSDDDDDDDNDEDVGFESGVKNPIDGNSVPLGLRVNKFGINLKSKLDAAHDVEDGVKIGGGFRLTTKFDQNSVPAGFRAKKFHKFDGVPNFNINGEMNSNGGFFANSPGDRNSAPPGFRAKKIGKSEGNPNPNIDPRGFNGFSSSRVGFGNKSNGRGVKRERGIVGEMVSSIRLLGEGFVKMEKMKMEMAMEIEQMRMEMEMKRNELVIESQKQIVDAFVKALVENKNQKTKKTASPES